MSTDVLEGQDGWLFLAGAVATLYDRNAPALSDAKLREWVRVIEARADRLKNMRIQYIHMPAPEKLTIYDNKLNAPTVDWRLSPASRLGEMLQRSPYAHAWLDLIQPLRAARDQRQFYPRTDSHWNAEGAFLAYKLLCERMGQAPDLDLLSRSHVDYHSPLDLSIKMEPPVSEWFKLYDFRKNSTLWYRNLIAQYLDTVRYGALIHGGSHVAFKNGQPSAAKKKILIFGDSFCSQRADSLTGMLAETATEVEFVWSPDLDWAYIKRARPDVVVYELAERSMGYVPNDDLSLRSLFWKRGLRAKWLQLKAQRGA